MKAAVMTEEKLAREENIEQVKLDIREAYAEKFAGHEDEDHLLKASVITAAFIVA